MARGSTGSLFLQIGGSADGLVATSKAARTALLSIQDAANDVHGAVAAGFAGLGKTALESSVADLDRNLKRTLDNIRANAKAALAAPENAGATALINVTGSEQAAEAAAQQAAEFRRLADAAAQVASEAGEAAKAEQVLAVAFEAQAVYAARQAAGLREQADLLARVGAAAGVATRAELDKAAADEAARQASVAAARAIADSLEPERVAREKYNAEIALTDKLLDEGLLTAEQYAAAQSRSANALLEVTHAAQLAADAQRRLYEEQARAARGDVEADRVQGAFQAVDTSRLSGKSAAGSGAVFQEAAANASAAQAMVAGVDALYAAQVRYDATIAEATRLRDADALSQERFAEVTRSAAAALDGEVRAAGERATAVQRASAATLDQAAGNRTDPAKDAAESGAVFEAAMQRDAAAARQLLAAIDPLYAAEQRRNDIVKEADRLVAAEALTEEEAARIKDAASKLTVRGNDEAARSHGQLNIGTLEAEHVARAFSDSINAGISPIRAFSLELPRAAQALSFFAAESGATEGTLGRLAGFLSGGWGTALVLGTSLLAPFIAKLLDGGDAAEEELEKLKQNAIQSAAADQAKALFAHTQEGLIDSTRRMTQELDKQNDSLRTNAERQNIVARASLDEQKGKRPGDVAALDAAKASLKAVQDQGSGFSESARAAHAGDLAKAQADVDAAQAKLDALDKSIVTASVDYQRSRIDLAAETAKRETNAIARINKLYDDQGAAAQRAATHAAQAGKTVTSALTDQLAAIERNRQAALKAEQEREAAANRKPNNNQVGRTIDVAEATRIAESIGGRVTSGYRSPEKQAELYQEHLDGRHDGPVARPGTSDHERGQAIDIAYGPGISIDAIRRAFQQQGVQIHQLLDEPAQRVFHVGFGPKGKSQEQTDREAKAKQDKSARDDDAYQQLAARANEQYLSALRGRGASISEAANASVADALAERDRLNQEAQQGVTLRRWTQSQADALVATNDMTAILKTGVITRKELSDLFDKQLEAGEHDRAAQDALIQIDADLATTRKARLAYEQQLLADRQEGERAGLQNVINKPDSTPEQVAQANADLAKLPAKNEAERRQLEVQNQGPLDSYKDQLRKHVGDMGDALQGVEVGGLHNLEDGFAGIISGSESAAQAVKRFVTSAVADLAKLVFEKAALSIFGFNTGVVDAPGHATGVVPGFAGGVIRGPGTGTSDSIPGFMEGVGAIRVSNGESIITAAATQANAPWLSAMNKGLKLPSFATGLVPSGQVTMRPLPSAASLAPRSMSGGAPITFDLRGAVMTEELLQQMNAISARHATVAMIGGAAQARQDAADQQYAAIP